MTIKANRAAAKAWEELDRKKREDERARAEVLAMIEVIKPFRDFMIRRPHPPALRAELEAWVEDLTGHKNYLIARDCNHLPPPIILPHDRGKPDV
jgi:hypothetical protein